MCSGFIYINKKIKYYDKINIYVQKIFVCVQFTPLVLLSVPLVSPESTISYLKLYHHHCQPIEHLYVYRHNANFMTMEMKQICAQLQVKCVIN